MSLVARIFRREQLDRYLETDKKFIKTMSAFDLIALGIGAVIGTGILFSRGRLPQPRRVLVSLFHLLSQRLFVRRRRCVTPNSRRLYQLRGVLIRTETWFWRNCRLGAWLGVDPGVRVSRCGGFQRLGGLLPVIPGRIPHWLSKGDFRAVHAQPGNVWKPDRDYYRGSDFVDVESRDAFIGPFE